MSNPTPLSPASQAVLDAFRTSYTGQGCLAAALRAAAQHLYHDWSAFNCIDALCEIADELEGQDQLTKGSN